MTFETIEGLAVRSGNNAIIGHGKPFLRLKTSSLLNTTLTLIAVCIVVQLSLGADPIVVAFALIGVGLGEVGYRAVEHVATTEIGGNCHAVA